MTLTDKLEIEETLGGFQASTEDQFLLNDLDAYPGNNSRFFPEDSSNPQAVSKDSIDDVLSSGNSGSNDDYSENDDPLASYQNDISFEDEFDISSIPTGKPSDFGHDDGTPTSSPFNEDDTDEDTFNVSNIDDFIHSPEQNPTPRIDNSPAVEPIKIQFDDQESIEEPKAKKVKKSKEKKPSKPLDRKTVIVFAMLISSMMVTMSILFLLWKQKQTKEALYAMKATILNHTSPNGKAKHGDSLSDHIISHSSDSIGSLLHSSHSDSIRHITSSEVHGTDSTSNHHKTVENHSTQHSSIARSTPKNHSVEHHSTHKKHAINTTSNINTVNYNSSNNNNQKSVSSKHTKSPEFALKVHSSFSKIDAYKKAEQLRNEGVSNVTVSEQKIRDRTIYNVRYGKFSTLDEATTASQKTSIPSRWIDRTK